MRARFTRWPPRSPNPRPAGSPRRSTPSLRGREAWRSGDGCRACTWRPASRPPRGNAICHFLIDPSPARDYLRASLLADVRRERPDVIVDAVASACFRWKWGAADRLQSFPALAEYVRQHYVLAAERNVGDGDDPVRLYVSREYLETRGRQAFQPSAGQASARVEETSRLPGFMPIAGGAAALATGWNGVVAWPPLSRPLPFARLSNSAAHGPPIGGDEE